MEVSGLRSGLALPDAPHPAGRSPASLPGGWRSYGQNAPRDNRSPVTCLSLGAAQPAAQPADQGIQPGRCRAELWAPGESRDPSSGQQRAVAARLQTREDSSTLKPPAEGLPTTPARPSTLWGLRRTLPTAGLCAPAESLSPASRCPSALGPRAALGLGRAGCPGHAGKQGSQASALLSRTPVLEATQLSTPWLSQAGDQSPPPPPPWEWPQ